MSIHPCCLTGFKWEGTPTGRIGNLALNKVYITGDNQDVAILLIHDLASWKFVNLRLLADHYSREANATVYLPDFFGGASVPIQTVLDERWDQFDLPGFLSENSREIREPEIFDCARALRKQYRKVGAVGFCYGGWAVSRLGAEEHQSHPLVDCISMGHPSLLIKKDIDEIAVPVQILAPEIDLMFNAEMKSHAFETLQTLNVAFDYQHFPGVAHAFCTRGDPKKTGEREAMVRAKNAAVGWMLQFLHDV